ncbi:DMT family protein [Novosphingobium sp. KACC 22771]|uniref:DMT family protein n=1 Tax=Novosphingobium sp. KACC 22771 TaxID=3025670 RepID=UPI002366393D|nr:DMT family protein [Novosphingobium sp. KACC 22771]WDF71086.1 DMT family protein [Novosphingobium sp. KACC 22771]
MNWGLILPPLMLAGSNLFMNVAWYGHLKAPKEAIWVAVLASWGLAFFEYWLAVPANRLGSKAYSLAQLKTMQEVFSLAGFVLVAWALFGQKPGLTQLAGFALIIAGAALIFKGN